MANFDNNGRVLGVILGGIAAGMMGTDEIHAAMARELIERRVADLTAEEREALQFARYRLVEYPPESGSYVVRTKRALAVLDRLLGGGK